MTTTAVYILMPVYNCEKFLDKSLSSINRQTYKNIKCVIYNDGSTDLSKNIIEEYIRKRPDCFVLINSPLRSGIANAHSELQNYTTKSSKSGDFVINLDSDDKIRTINFVSSFVERMIETNADVCLWGFDVIYENESLKANSFITVKELEVSRDILTFICNSPNKTCTPQEIPNLHLFTSLGWTKGYKFDLFKTLPKPKTSIDSKFDDFVYMTGLFGAKRITALPWEKYGYEYLKRHSSVTGERKPEDLMNVIENLEIFWKYSVKNSICREFVKLKINDYERLAIMLVEAQKFTKEHLETYKKASIHLLSKVNQLL